MRGAFDFSSWSGIGTTLLGLVLVSLVAVGIRLVFMQTLQRRRERENRQINERLKTLIAAYKTLGSSFTGDLSVDPLRWTPCIGAISACARRRPRKAPAMNRPTTRCPSRRPSGAGACATRWRRRCRT